VQPGAWIAAAELAQAGPLLPQQTGQITHSEQTGAP
jgi:hypothetical protein